MLQWGTYSGEEGEERAGRSLLDEGDGDAKHDDEKKKGAKKKSGKKRNGKKRRRGGSCGGGRRCRREEGDVDVVGRSVRGEFGRARRRKRRRSR